MLIVVSGEGVSLLNWKGDTSKIRLRANQGNLYCLMHSEVGNLIIGEWQRGEELVLLMIHVKELGWQR